MSDHPFYHLTLHDFQAVASESLQIGDRIAWSMGSKRMKYGAIPIADIIYPDEGIVFAICFALPPGALIQSTPSRSIAICWNGKEPAIRVMETLAKRDRILIQREKRDDTAIRAREPERSRATSGAN